MLSWRQVARAFTVVLRTRRKAWMSDQVIRFCRRDTRDIKPPAMASVRPSPASTGASDVTPMTSLDPATASEGASDVGSGAMSTGSGSGLPGGGMASNDAQQPPEGPVNMLEGPSTPSLTSGRGESDGSDSDSDCSGVSDISGLNWKPTAGPICWVQEQIGAGVDPRDILRALRPGLTHIPTHIDDLTLWKVVIEILSEPPRREKLRHINTLSDVVRLIRGARNVIVLTGAGVSVSCGIPDFRSRDGIYARLAVDFPDLPDPQAMFDIQYFRRDPRPFFKFAKEIYPGQFRPSPCHRFIRLLERQGKLLRNYTQNIDTLEQQAGIQNVIQCHGSFATATCQRCRYKVDAEEIREDIFAQKIPRCPRCTPDPLSVNETQGEKDGSGGCCVSQGCSGNGAETRNEDRGERDSGETNADALAKTPENLPQSSEEGAGKTEPTFDSEASTAGSAAGFKQDTAASREEEKESVQQGQRPSQDSANVNVSSTGSDDAEATASPVATSRGVGSSEANANSAEEDDNLCSSGVQHHAEGRASGPEGEAGDADQAEEPAATGDEDTGDSGFCIAGPDVDTSGSEVHRLASVMKPDIVFFGEGLSEEFHNAMERDKDECDLLIVIGSSLKVRPVALIPSSIQPDVAQILINREPLPNLNCDVQLLGDCDVIVDHLCHLLGGIYDELHTNPLLTELEELPPRAKAPPPVADPTNEHDTEALKHCWQRKLTESVAARLPHGTYLYQSPSRYIFSGAEVLMDPDDEEEHADDHDDDDDVDESAAANKKSNGAASEPSTSKAAGESDLPGVKAGECDLPGVQAGETDLPGVKAGETDLSVVKAGETDLPGVGAGETDLNAAGFFSGIDSARDSVPEADFNVDDALSSVDVTGFPTGRESSTSLSAQDSDPNVNSDRTKTSGKREAGEVSPSTSPKRLCARDEPVVSQADEDAAKTGNNYGISPPVPEDGNGVDKS